MSGGRERVFDFCDKSAVSEKGFDDFNDFSRDVELGQFVEETDVPDPVKGFFHVKENGGGVYVVVKVLTKLVSKFGQL